MIVAKEEGAPPPFPPSGGDPGFGGDGSLKRNIPAKHDFDPKALKPLSRALFSASVALGHSVTAYKEFTRLKSSSISPDGMLGGRGYVLKVKELRAKLQQACELLSSVTDTMFDEINAPHWQPKLGELGANDAEDVTEFIDEAGEVLDDPEGFGEKELREVEKKNDGPKGTPNSTKWKDTEEGQKGSQMPGGGAKETGNEARPFGQAIGPKEAAVKTANSSLPVTTLPGPRVDHLDRGEQTGPGGSFNKDEPLVQDDWGQSEGVGTEYNYESEWSNQLLDKAASCALWGETALPDGKNDGTETDANDFGIGYGAKGKGSEGYGTKSPDGRGVFGPSSDLPNDPGAPTRDDEEGAGPYLDGIERNVWACEGGCKGGCKGSCSCGQSKLPFDGPDPVARSDYYEGDKGNLVNVNPHSGVPGMSPPSPEAPLKPRPSHMNEHVFSQNVEAWRPAMEGESRMPGDQAPALYNFDRDLPDVGQKLERQDVPLVKYDWTTHQHRHDVQDLWNYDRTETNG